MTYAAYPARIEELVKKTALLLLARNTRLVSVESCTGGGVGYFCTSLAGASHWYEGGYITYSNACKIHLGVDSNILTKYGAVSVQCADAMARAALHKKEPHYYALAITGIAGPDGGSDQKPVGTVCFAWATATQNQITQLVHFKGDRNAIVMQSIIFSLQGLHTFIRQNESPEK